MGLLNELFKFVLFLGALAGLVAGALLVFFVDVYTVPHNGMAPTLIHGDEVLVWRGAGVDMANVMLCEHPGRAGELVLARAVAFAGHTISTDRFGYLYVDEDRVDLEGLSPMHFYDVTREKHYTMSHGLISYGRGHQHEYFKEQDTGFSLTTYAVNRGVYLLGDNRSAYGDDSRDFGEVDPSACKGQVFMRWKPAPANGDDIDHGYFDLLLD